MKVFKFGGASVSSAMAIKNVAKILEMHPGDKVVVVSAMGKSTNALEAIAKRYFKGEDSEALLKELHSYHAQITNELQLEAQDLHRTKLLFKKLEDKLGTESSLDFNYEYDQIVSFGELISTSIVSAYLKKEGLQNQWLDVRKCIKTDSTYREALVNWELSANLSKTSFTFNDTSLYITQGFIAGTTINQTTTLGREGSDFSAAIIANLLQADSVTIWKNVPGVLNADPRDFNDTEKLDELSYKEAIELSYSGAQVIHPKTMKPLRNKNIPLFVRPFDHPEEPGTVIRELSKKQELPPIFILKKHQALLTLESNDFSFVSVNELSEVFNYFKSKLIKVNLIQQSAIDLSLCIDEPEFDIQEVVEKLSTGFKVRYNSGLTLATIRFYNYEAIGRMMENRTVLMEQKSRRTIKMVMK